MPAAPGDTFREHLLSKFLRNKASAASTHQDAALATDAGALGVNQISRCGTQGGNPKNLSRDLLRYVKTLDASGVCMPQPYFVTLPIMDTKTSLTIFVEHPVLLPHEVIFWLLSVRKCQLSDLCTFTREDNYMSIHHSDFCASFGLEESATIPLGFHGDGAPFQKSHHRSSSTEVYSWNFIVDKNGKRYLFTNINKDFLLPDNQTTYPLLEVFRWSMVSLFSGHWPQSRHDGKCWQDSDKSRRQSFGPLGFNGVLLQLRGDWPWYQGILKVPTHTSMHPCFKCRCSRDDKDALNFRNTGGDAPWRSSRRESLEWVPNPANMCPLLGCPGFDEEFIIIGFLHCHDLGVTQDVLGNIFWEALDWLGLPGSSREQRCKVLWGMVQVFYKQHQIKKEDQIQALYVKMIKKDKAPPKIKTKGKQCKYLVRFGVTLAQQLDNKWGTWHTNQVLMLIQALSNIYTNIDTDWDVDKCAAWSLQVATCYEALEKEAENGGGVSWRIKPKLHMMQEMHEYQSYVVGNPKNHMEYKDEDFCGEIASLATRRGGANTHAANALGVMAKYRALMQMGHI